MQNIIYALQDPNTHEIRYIGKTSKGMARPQKHLVPSYYNNKRTFHFPIYRWIRKLASFGQQPKILIIQQFDNTEYLNAAEIYWISFFKQQKCPLLNSTKGGDGVVDYKFTTEVRAKLSLKQKGRLFSESHKNNLKKVWHKSRHKQDKNAFKVKVSHGTKKWWNSNPHLHNKIINNLTAQGHNKIKLIDQNGIIYNSCTEAAKFIKCSPGAVALAVRKNRQCKGFLFRKVV